jgi:hypothetical protein
MEIGPISAIRAVPMISPETAAPDLSRVVKAENRGQSGDDEYTPANRKAARGLEDEEDDLTEESIEAEAVSPVLVSPSTKVSFFA